jgi:hypothetical protein
MRKREINNGWMFKGCDGQSITKRLREKRAMDVRDNNGRLALKMRLIDLNDKPN